MSRYIEEKAGEYIITLADPDACHHMYNEVCCNDRSPMLGGWDYGYCEYCPLFEKEDMKKPAD